MKVLGICVLGAMLLVPMTASAKDSGFELGARLGYGIPMGKLADEADSDLKDWSKRQIPLWLDLGYRANPNIFVGGYLSYGFASVGSGIGDICDQDGVDCSASDLRLGAQLQYHFMPGESTDAWGGLGVGWEHSSLSASAAGGDVTLSTSGFEFALLQGGVDFQVADSVALGPFLGLTLARFSSVNCDSDAGCGDFDGDIENKAFHEWLFLGVRGAFGPF